MIVVFTGHAGLRKRAVVERLAVYALHRAGIIRDYRVDSPQDELNKDQSKKYVQVLSPEGLSGLNILQFLQHENPELQKKEWREKMRRVVEQIHAMPADTHVFVVMHATFHYRGKQFCFWDPELLRQLNPDVFVTLINDLTSVSRNLDPSYALRLKDILAWRAAETQIVDYAAAVLRLPAASGQPERDWPQNYVFSTRHSPRTLYELLFEPGKPRVYASYPISSTRDDPAMVHQINRFCEFIRNEYVVFEPTTIDDAVVRKVLADEINKVIRLASDSELFRSKLRSQSSTETAQELARGGKRYGADTPLERLPDILPAGATVTFNPEIYRWPGTSAESLYPGDVRNDPVEYLASDMREAWDYIYNDIYIRDVRMIDQSDGLLAWRPLYGGRLHRMTNTELNHARSTVTPSGIGIPIFLFNAQEDDVPGESPARIPGLSLSRPISSTAKPRLFSPEQDTGELDEALRAFCASFRDKITLVRPRHSIFHR